MNQLHKDLGWLLLQPGHYLVKTLNAKGKQVYKVYSGRQVPVQYFSNAQAQKF